MPEMCWKIRSECCGCFVGQSVSNLASRCCPGRRDCARRMEFGPGIGMAKWQRRHLFGHIVRRTMRCRSACTKFTSVATNVTTGFINTDCGNDGLPRILEAIVEGLAAASACLGSSAYDTNAATTTQSALSA